MNPLFLLIPIVLPIFGGLALLIRPVENDIKRRILCEAVACVTSACVWAAALWMPHRSQSLSMPIYTAMTPE